jgi:F-type H+-transporting ATPase subunit gamma
MANVLDIRRRIRSVRSTLQITKAMKMVSAAKLRRAQDRVIAGRPYAALLRQVLGNVAAAAGADERVAANPLLAQRPEQRIHLVLVTADKGLAGAFNANLIKESQRFLEARREAGATVELELLGRKGRDFWRKQRDITITVDDRGVYVLGGKWIEKVASPINVNEIESLNYLHRVLKNAGVFEMLEEAGIKENGTVSILGYEFDYVK